MTKRKQPEPESVGLFTAEVRSTRKAGRWRAGRFFGPSWTKVEVTGAELERIERDPLLEVKKD